MRKIQMNSVEGRVFNIQKFSVHDGPGIRDLVFMKGCPLICKWCSNPESQSSYFEIAYNQSRCIGCGICAGSCPVKAIFLTENNGINIERKLCDNCGQCAEHCPAKALVLKGEWLTVAEVLKVVQEQNAAWRANGGITISGGEPLMQADFVAELLAECRNIGIPTAIETCGFATWENAAKVCRHCDLIFFDIKCLDSEKHKSWTGVDNRTILENLKMISAQFPETPLIVRTPIIPGFSDTEDDVLSIAEFLKQITTLTDYELLPYHAFGEVKYKQLDRDYLLENIAQPDKDFISTLNQKVRNILSVKNHQG